MKAILKENRWGMNVVRDRRSKHFVRELSAIVFHNETHHAYACVVMRFYSTPSRTSVCLWVHDHCSWARNLDAYPRCSADTSGSGYANRPDGASEAAYEAITAAGIELSEELREKMSRSTFYIEEAVEAIALAVWDGEPVTVFVHDSHE